MASRQVEKRDTTCLRGKSGFQASGKARSYLPVKEKWLPGKRKSKKLLACEGKVASRQAEKRETTCL